MKVVIHALRALYITIKRYNTRYPHKFRISKIITLAPVKSPHFTTKAYPDNKCKTVFPKICNLKRKNGIFSYHLRAR